MTKRQLIDEIVILNQTAEPGFLARFDDGQLDEYLRHLRRARTPRLSGDPHRYDRYFRSCPPVPAARPARPADAAQTAVAVVETAESEAEPAEEPFAYEAEAAADDAAASPPLVHEAPPAPDAEEDDPNPLDLQVSENAYFSESVETSREEADAPAGDQPEEEPEEAAPTAEERPAAAQTAVEEDADRETWLF